MGGFGAAYFFAASGGQHRRCKNQQKGQREIAGKFHRMLCLCVENDWVIGWRKNVDLEK